MSKKILIAYFSCSGRTEKVAQIIAEITNGELYKIKPEVPYSNADLNWMDKNSRTSKEKDDRNIRPAIIKDINIEKYETIYIGFPIWWYIEPNIINTFIESYNFEGKTIIPFATSGGSNVGESDKYLQASYPNANWKPAKLLNGMNKEKIKLWIESL